MQHSPRCRLINFSTILWKTTCYLWKTGVFWGLPPRPNSLKRLSSQGISAIDPSSWTLNVACPTQLNTMVYSVQVKRNYSEYKDYTFEDTYFQGSERCFNSEQEAVQYFQSFEDWEQELLVIEVFPF